MTINEMTNDELDRHIAELRGYKYKRPYSRSHDHRRWWSWTKILKDGTLSYGSKYPPSFTTDPRYAMELLKEMPFQTTLHNYENELDGTKMHWGCTVANLVKPSETIQALADTPERAIAEAWLQWRERMMYNKIKKEV